MAAVMSCPLNLTYPAVFDPFTHPTLVAAMLSAGPDGIIQPADCERWFSRDQNEMFARGWVRQHQLRCDRKWSYRLTEIGVEQAAAFRADGWNFDDYDAWHGDTLYRPQVAA
ncbi:hypothetical protein U1872_06275 [Sphingomonas sp. RB3P16]|uniref:hypothetical protein n=1 Tax=Parasphingomonas frigoris TaxID=3096163 RepID=UPI002FC7F674